MKTNNAIQYNITFPDECKVVVEEFDPEQFREDCIEVMTRHYLDDKFGVFSIASSFGKDSNLLLLLVIEAIKRLKEQGKANKPIAIMTADTKIENPLVARLVEMESEKIRAYALKHKLPIHLIVGKPSVGAAWVSRIIGGRALSPIPGSDNWCTSDFKVIPLVRKLKEWSISQGITGDVLKCTGTRFSESSLRGRRMSDRGDSATDVVLNSSGEYILCPIADLSSDEVWELLAYYKSGVFGEIYTDLNDLFSVYEKAGNSSCAVVSDDRLAGLERGDCGGRTGCIFCTKVAKDLSLENMLIEHPEFSNIYNIREYIAGITFDYSKRNWFGRSINDGFIKIGPDSYSPNVVQDLLRFCLTADIIEQERSHAVNEKPLFQIITIEDLIGVDYYWSLYGYAPAYEAWRIYKDVVEDGNRYFAPKVNSDMSERPPMPEPRYLHVGTDWAIGGYDGKDYSFGGLRNLLAEELEKDTGADYELRTLKNGNEILDIERGKAMTVNLDSEDAMDFLQFMLDYEIEKAEEWNVLPSTAARTYLQYGVVSYHNMSLLDDMLRRVTFREYNGLSGTDDVSKIMHKTISEAEMKLATGQAFTPDLFN